jgi:hypothetical protein
VTNLQLTNEALLAQLQAAKAAAAAAGRPMMPHVKEAIIVTEGYARQGRERHNLSPAAAAAAGGCEPGLGHFPGPPRLQDQGYISPSSAAAAAAGGGSGYGRDPSLSEQRQPGQYDMHRRVGGGSRGGRSPGGRGGFRPPSPGIFHEGAGCGHGGYNSGGHRGRNPAARGCFHNSGAHDWDDDYTMGTPPKQQRRGDR